MSGAWLSRTMENANLCAVANPNRRRNSTAPTTSALLGSLVSECETEAEAKAVGVAVGADPDVGGLSVPPCTDDNVLLSGHISATSSTSSADEGAIQGAGVDNGGGGGGGREDEEDLC